MSVSIAADLLYAHYVYNLLTTTGMPACNTAGILRMYTIRILLPIKRNN